MNARGTCQSLSEMVRKSNHLCHLWFKSDVSVYSEFIDNFLTFKRESLWYRLMMTLCSCNVLKKNTSNKLCYFRLLSRDLIRLIAVSMIPTDFPRYPTTGSF